MRKKRGCPTCRPVTAVTVHRGGQMVRRLKGGNDSPPWRMALHTLRRRSAKYALQVAPLAHHLRVTATKREAGAAMIKFDICAVTSLGRSGIRRQQGRATYRQKPGNNCPGKEPTSYPASQLRHLCICHWSTTVASASILSLGTSALMRHLYSWDYNPKHG
jgi:hypothetical protein